MAVTTAILFTALMVIQIMYLLEKRVVIVLSLLPAEIISLVVL